jgi:23S rRNA (pseudouridine1915-N3)-methyltransferase
MRLNIIAVGTKMPKWTEIAFSEYAKRFSREFPLSLTEIPLPKRPPGSSVDRYIAQEGSAILSAIPEKSITIALDERGKLWNTQELATQITHFQNNTPQINFLIGGPDGLSKTCLEKSQIQWSLSPLTLPHPLVRVILVEQLYRAISILNNHPYHRS